MEKDITSEINKIKILPLNNNNRTRNKQKQLELEENKTNNNSRNLLIDKILLQNKYNNLLLRKRNSKLREILNSKYNNYPFTSQASFQNNFLSIDKLSKDKPDKKFKIKTINIINRIPSTIKNLNAKEKKLDFMKLLYKNKSTSSLLNNSNQILPLIKPRKILINICSGPYEFKIDDINKRYLSFKKFGKNSIYMGEKYNPENYDLISKDKIGRNYYGAIFSK
jgi:hypothetical protein